MKHLFVGLILVILSLFIMTMTTTSVQAHCEDDQNCIIIEGDVDSELLDRIEQTIIQYETERVIDTIDYAIEEKGDDDNTNNDSNDDNVNDELEEEVFSPCDPMTSICGGPPVPKLEEPEEEDDEPEESESEQEEDEDE